MRQRTLASATLRADLTVMSLHRILDKEYFTGGRTTCSSALSQRQLLSSIRRG